MPVANLIFDSLWSSRPPEQMSCLWLPSVAGVVPPCSGPKRTPSSDFRPFFLFFLSSTWIGAPVEWDPPLCRLLICVAVTNSCIIGCLFTSLVSLSLLRRLAVKKSPQGSCEMHLPHQTEFPNAWECFCMMFHYSRWGEQIYIYRRLHKLLPLLKLMQCFSERWSLWDPPATRPTFFAVYSHWCMSVVALARGFSIKASRHLLRSSSCLIRARCEVAERLDWIGRGFSQSQQTDTRSGTKWTLTPLDLIYICTQ